MTVESLSLGTAQFGLDYGITNARGKIPFSEVKKILQHALQTGVTHIDTAAAYGISETVLGECFSRIHGNFSITTKYPEGVDASVEQAFAESLLRLRQRELYGYLFHNYLTYEKCPSLWQAFQQLRDEGKVHKIGFSLYDPLQAHVLLERNIDCDILQVPYSVVDQRFEAVFDELRSRGVEIHVRSVFLQGILLQPPDRLGKSFWPLKSRIQKLVDIARTMNTSVATLCMAFAADDQRISHVVIGVDSLENWKTNLETFWRFERIAEVRETLKGLREDDTNIITPTRWVIERQV